MDEHVQWKTIAKRALQIISHAVSILFLALLLSYIQTTPTIKSSALFVDYPVVLPKQEQIKTPPEKPRIALVPRLKIPLIGVDSVVIPMGLTPDGAMDIPKDPDDVAWFNLGQRPGENGSAVIAGHYGWKDNLPAVFDHLHEIRKGDRVFIEDEKGETTIFIVREIRRYGKDEAASEVFRSNDGKSHLNLITCAGVWNTVEKSRSERLVVFTDKE